MVRTTCDVCRVAPATRGGVATRRGVAMAAQVCDEHADEIDATDWWWNDDEPVAAD